MICSEARIRTAHATGYLADLAGRLSMADAVDEGAGEAAFDLKGGHCELRADAERLVIACSAEEEAVVSELRRLMEQNFPDRQPGDDIEINWHTVSI